MKKDIDDVMLTSLHKKHQLTCYDVYCPCRDIITTQAFIKWHIIT